MALFPLLGALSRRPGSSGHRERKLAVPHLTLAENGAVGGMKHRMLRIKFP